MSSMPGVEQSGTQVGLANPYDVNELTALVTPFTEEAENAAVENVETDVTQDATTGVITVTAKIIFQSFLNTGKSLVTIERNPAAPNIFEAPLSLLTIDHVLGMSIYTVTQTYSEGTIGDWHLIITGDNVLSVTQISNPFD